MPSFYVVRVIGIGKIGEACFASIGAAFDSVIDRALKIREDSFDSQWLLLCWFKNLLAELTANAISRRDMVIKYINNLIALQYGMLSTHFSSLDIRHRIDCGICRHTDNFCVLSYNTELIDYLSCIRRLWNKYAPRHAAIDLFVDQQRNGRPRLLFQIALKRSIIDAIIVADL